MYLTFEDKTVKKFLIVVFLFILLMIPSAPSFASCFAHASPYMKNNQGLMLQLRFNTCRPNLQGIFDRNNVKYNCRKGINDCVKA